MDYGQSGSLKGENLRTEMFRVLHDVTPEKPKAV
jgi:hypothetical protein